MPAGARVQFDPTLVRGMGYYTGTIFEMVSPAFPSSIAGGGRYDRMIGRLLGREVPACGFSIGFERLITILTERGAARARTGGGGIGPAGSRCSWTRAATSPQPWPPRARSAPRATWSRSRSGARTSASSWTIS